MKKKHALIPQQLFQNFPIVGYIDNFDDNVWFIKVWFEIFLSFTQQELKDIQYKFLKTFFIVEIENRT